MFFSVATNLVAGTAGATWRLYVHDLDGGSTQLVQDAPDETKWSAGISGDGMRIVCLGLAPTDATNPYLGAQAVLFDRATGQRHVLSTGPGGELPTSSVVWVKITDDGRTVYFKSRASNLLPGVPANSVYARGPDPTVPPTRPTPGPGGPALAALVPARLLETRPGERTTDGQAQGAGRLPAGTTIELPVAGRGGVPANATAVLLNVTAVSPDAAGYVTVWPCGQPRPLASHVNYTPGAVVPNAVLAAIGTNGNVCLYTQAATDLLADVNGYAPG